MGLAILLGAAMSERRVLLLNLGFIVGFATFAFTWPLSAGRPTLVQVAAIALAILAELAAFYFLLPLFAAQGARATTIASLAIVGAHFLIMTPGFGWPIALLSVLATINALAGGAWPGYSLNALWAIDGALKLSAGVLMYFSHLLPAWPKV